MLLKCGSIFIAVIFKKLQKNMYLKLIDATHAQCSAPWFVSKQDVIEFIRARESWLLKKAAQLKSKAVVDDNHLDSSQVYYLGKPYQQVVETSHKNRIVLSDQTMVVYLSTMDEIHYQNLFATYAKQTILELVDTLRPRYDQYIQAYRLMPPEIKCRILKSAWGNCYPRKNRIQLSTRLVHYPVDVIEAVIAHEYVHLVVPNHSKRFYDILTSWLPDYTQRHEKLKGIEIE